MLRMGSEALASVGTAVKGAGVAVKEAGISAADAIQAKLHTGGAQNASSKVGGHNSFTCKYYLLRGFRVVVQAEPIKSIKVSWSSLSFVSSSPG